MTDIKSEIDAYRDEIRSLTAEMIRIQKRITVLGDSVIELIEQQMKGEAT
jgi:hypothetical protein